MIVGSLQLRQVAEAATTNATKLIASPSPSPSPSPSSNPSDDQTTQSIKDRITKIMEKRGDQVKGIIDQVGVTKRGFIGEVERVTDKTITVKNTKGSEILTLENDVILIKENKRISIDDIAVGDWVIAMGYVDKGQFSLKKVVVSSASLMPPVYNTYLGSIQSIAKNQTQLEIMPRGATQAVTITLNKQTVFEDAQSQTIDRRTLQTDLECLVISYTDNDTQVAKVVHLLVAAPTTPNGK